VGKTKEKLTGGKRNGQEVESMESELSVVKVSARVGGSG